jgi:two-component system, chemotaxis family, protein-glutamate methylesterase/glutaminase
MDRSEGRVIAIGGSAGAIGAVRALCDSLAADIPAAVCIVIHVGASGHNLIADVFQQRCPIPVQTAVDGERLENGRAYVAAADHHLIVVDGTAGPRPARKSRDAARTQRSLDHRLQPSPRV